jgi:hypothetical protein
MLVRVDGKRIESRRFAQIAVGSARPTALPAKGRTKRGIIPLGAAGALFRAIVGFLEVSSLKGEGLSAPVALISNLSIVFTTTCAIAVGAWTGYLLGQSRRRDQLV